MKTCAVLLALLLLAPQAARAQSAPPYVAVLSDGTRVEGDRLTGWHEPGAVPHLQGVRLHDGNRQLLWFRNRSIRPYSLSSNRLGFVEFVGGDRLIGRVVGGQPSGVIDGLNVPAHVLVKPAAPLRVPGLASFARARILPGRIQRVVWGRASQQRLQPGTVFYLDGRQLGFLRLRWKEDSVLLLVKNGTRELELSKISEVHLPRIDPWQAYYQELAILSPSCRSRLMRLETAGGLIATGSALRFLATPYATPHQKLQAINHLKRLDDQIKAADLAKAASHKGIQPARVEYQRQLAESETRKKAAKQISDKAVADMRQRIDNQRKADAARLATLRQQLAQQLRAAEQAMQQRLAAMPAQQRDKELKAFRQRQAQTRKSREKSLEQERLRHETQSKQRQKQLEQFIKSETQKLKKHEQDLAKRLAPAKQQFDGKTRQFAQRSRHVESLRSQRASVRGPQGYPGSWHHMVQPVWSLHPLWIPFSSIHTRLSFAPDQVPLSRMHPSATVSPALLPWHLDRNSVGQLLRSGGQRHGWGFAVHAYSELSFALPPCAKSFRSRLGLDHLALAGGCVQARAYVGSVKTNPVYQSPLLVGSQKTVDTGWIQLRPPAKGPKHLILQADPAHDNRPRGADPLNIRDMLDWLDPQLGLDTAKLRDEVRGQIGGTFAASQAWKLKLDSRGVYTWTSHLHKPEGSALGRFVTMIRAQGQPLALSREMTIAPADNWLAVRASLQSGQGIQPKTITLHVADKEIQPEKIPPRQAWQKQTAPLVFPLAQHRGSKVTLELRQPAGGQPLHWQTVSISKAPPSPYRLARILALAGKSNVQVSHGLGRALQSGRLGDKEKLAALEIAGLGGVVNHASKPAVEATYDRLVNVMVGCDWKGGDKTFATLRKLPNLVTLLVTEDSGISSGAVDKLQTAMPKLTIKKLKRTPSLNPGEKVYVTWRNHCPKDLVILFVTEFGNVKFSRHLKAGQEMKRDSLNRHRYEAYYHRTDFTLAEQYNNSKLISSTVVAPDAVWEIKPPAK